LTRVLCVLLRQECQHVYASADTGSHHVVFFPCLQFLQDRLALYKERGVGVAIWELGQGTTTELVNLPLQTRPHLSRGLDRARLLLRPAVRQCTKRRNSIHKNATVMAVLGWVKPWGSALLTFLTEEGGNSRWTLPRSLLVVGWQPQLLPCGFHRQSP
jgi:hypothetical protein